jgi:hypothetical protein
MLDLRKWYQLGKLLYPSYRLKGNSSLKAAGTPMITPLPVNSLERLTLFPGEPSTRSMFGRESPVLTMARAVT